MRLPKANAVQVILCSSTQMNSYQRAYGIWSRMTLILPRFSTPINTQRLCAFALNILLSELDSVIRFLHVHKRSHLRSFIT